jgi:hypothetical protein
MSTNGECNGKQNVHEVLEATSQALGATHICRYGFRSKRRTALVTRVPTFFSSSTPMSFDASADMVAETMSGHFGGGYSAWTPNRCDEFRIRPQIYGAGSRLIEQGLYACLAALFGHSEKSATRRTLLHDVSGGKFWAASTLQGSVVTGIDLRADLPRNVNCSLRE